MMTRTALAMLVALAALGAVASSPVYPVWVEGGDAETIPSNRQYHDVVQDSKGNLWLFGGFNTTGDSPFNDLYKMSVNNNYTWSIVDTSASVAVPSPRGDFCWAIDKNDNIFLFGGSSTNTYYFDKPVFGDLWMFSTTSLIWTLIRDTEQIRNSGGRDTPGPGTSDSHPGPRVLMTCWFDDETNSFWMHGGYLQFSYYADLWSYDIESDIWSWVSGTWETNTYSNSSVEIGVAYTDKFPGSAGQHMATKDLDGNVWMYGGWMVNNYGNQLWRLKLSTLEWTYFGGNITRESLEGARLTPRYDGIGTFSANNHPPGTLYGALVYAGNGKLALLTNSFISNMPYMSINLWHYDIASNEWAMMYAVTNDTSYSVPTYRGTFREVDPTVNIGERIGYGRSNTKGNVWVTRGKQNNPLGPVADTFVFPAKICSTDLAPSCPSNSECVDRMGWAECVCMEGETCDQGTGPQSSNGPADSQINDGPGASLTPIKSKNGAGAFAISKNLGILALVLALLA